MYAKEESQMYPEEHAVWTLIKELYLKDRQHPDIYKVTEALKRLAMSEQVNSELYVEGIADLYYYDYNDPRETPSWFREDYRELKKIFGGNGRLFGNNIKKHVENLVRAIFWTSNSKINFEAIRFNLNEIARWYDFNEAFLANDYDAFLMHRHGILEEKKADSYDDDDYSSNDWRYEYMYG